MTLFRGRNEKNRSRKRVIRTCCEGEVLDISMNSNPAISSRILGEGFSVKCSGEDITAPIAGTVKDISDKGHSYAILGGDGVNVLVCITADDKQEELEPQVSEGDLIEAGALLCRKQGAEAAVIVTNTEIMSKFRIAEGVTRTAEDGVMIYEL
ncbi:MAG: PTS glucose transporter subunit IIA [Ruminococcus sp.]|nr:PTS glucose transporter subunit IIA [Ruminococcus sp.]